MSLSKLKIVLGAGMIMIATSAMCQEQNVQQSTTQERTDQHKATDFDKDGKAVLPQKIEKTEEQKRMSGESPPLNATKPK